MNFEWRLFSICLQTYKKFIWQIRLIVKAFWAFWGHCFSRPCLAVSLRNRKQQNIPVSIKRFRVTSWLQQGYNSYFFQDSSLYVCANKVALKKMMCWIFSAFLFVSMTLIQPNPLAEAKPADGDQCLLEEGNGCVWDEGTKPPPNCCGEGLMCERTLTLTCVPKIPADGDQCLEEGDDCEG